MYKRKMPAYAGVTPEQRARQFELERHLAEEVLASSRDERPTVMRAGYDRLYREATWHPDMHTTPTARAARIARQASLVRRTVGRACQVLEVGCGDGDLLSALARAHPRATFTGVDISAEKLNRSERQPLPNLTFHQGDCVEPEGAPGMYDLVISSQVLEHFHPEDVPIHLRAVRRLLAPGGIFVLETPNRYTGPHDVSAFFSPVASGTHLREWTVAELVAALHTAGFATVRTDIPLLAHLRRVMPLPGDLLLMPAAIKVATERTCALLPRGNLRLTLFRLSRMDNIVLFAHA